MDNQEKLATKGTQDEEIHKTICVGHHYTPTNTNNVNKTKQLEVKTNRTSLLCGNLNGHHNMKLRT
jgi:hypothetical protein